MRVKIKVQVKPYVKQYLENHFNGDEVVIRSDAGDPITSKMYDLIQRSDRYYRYKLGDEYSETFTFVVTDWAKRLIGLDISAEKTISFNYFVDQLIKERLFILLDALQCYQKIKIKSVINNYIDHNNLLELGMSYEMLKKAYYRYRTRNTKQCWHIPLDNLVPKNHRKVA